MKECKNFKRIKMLKLYYADRVLKF